jgi:opacity protein-like surface antigen
MPRISRILRFCLPLLCALCGAQMASAQRSGMDAGPGGTPKVEIFGGYSYVRADLVISGTPISLHGASGSVAYNVNDWLGLVADVGYYRQGAVTADRLSLDIQSYQFGPRISMRRHEHFVPYVQGLAGGGHAGGTLYTTSLGDGVAPLGTSNALLLTAGIGMDWKISPRLGIRILQAEYLYSRFDNANHGNQQNNVRLSTGLVFSFGRR